MNLDLLNDLLKEERPFRIRQINHGVFKELKNSWDDFTVLPKDLINKLNKNIPLDIDAEIISGNDGTQKALITLADGLRIESVLIRNRVRNTICVSSQVGCPLGCKFCLTGSMGFKRNLNKWEIIEQVLLFARLLNQEEKKITNIVFMGMGEPFLNYQNVMDSIRFLNDPNFFGLAGRRFSISTAGITGGIKKLASEKIQVNLAISLHAANDCLRSQLMPVNNRYPLKEVVLTTRDYFLKTGRKVMFEYIMIKGINDREADAKELLGLINGIECVINLIPCNSGGGYLPSSKESVSGFKEILIKGGATVTQRVREGEDVFAACGQLAGK